MRAMLAVRSVSVLTIPLLMAGLTAGASVATPAGAFAEVSAGASATLGAASVSHDVALKAVAATSRRNAWAVGCSGCLTTSPHALLMRWNGATWKRVAIAGGSGSSLDGVAAISRHNAWAVGTSGNGTTLILRWNGTTWQPALGPASRTRGALDAVTASSSHNAWAVGSTASGRALALHWNGQTWKRVHTHSPAGSSFAAVAASSSHNAWAVGGRFVQADNGDVTLIEHWNGKTWKRAHSPSPVGNGAGLSAVVVTSPHNAWAVGCSSCGIGGFANSLIEHWNGKAWKKVSSPNPGGGGILAAAAATSSRRVMAVGTFYTSVGDSFSQHTFVVRWDGKAWKKLSSPNRGAAAGLSGVSAVSAHRTWAVGSFQTKAGSSASTKPLILQGRGTSFIRSGAMARLSTASTSQVAVLSCLRKRDAKPANHVVTCANATASWRHVKWSRWAASSASGKGDLLLNSCTPTCAKGRFASYPARIRLSAPRTTTKFGRLYSKATFSYSVQGKHKKARFGLFGPVHSTARRVPLQTKRNGEFFSPLPKVGLNCEIDAETPMFKEALCETFQPAESVTMSPKGKIKKCTGPHAGEHCLGDPGEHTPTLPYGRWSGAGPFRCLSTRSGMLCTVTKGAGFLMSATRITRIRGY